MQFEWDREKAKRNLRKHKVPFEEAMTGARKGVKSSFVTFLLDAIEERLKLSVFRQ